MFSVNNRNIRTCFALISGVPIVDIEQIDLCWVANFWTNIFSVHFAIPRKMAIIMDIGTLQHFRKVCGGRYLV